MQAQTSASTMENIRRFLNRHATTKLALKYVDPKNNSQQLAIATKQVRIITDLYKYLNTKCEDFILEHTKFRHCAIDMAYRLPRQAREWVTSLWGLDLEYFIQISLKLEAETDKFLSKWDPNGVSCNNKSYSDSEFVLSDANDSSSEISLADTISEVSTVLDEEDTFAILTDDDTYDVLEDEDDSSDYVPTRSELDENDLLDEMYDRELDEEFKSELLNGCFTDSDNEEMEFDNEETEFDNEEMEFDNEETNCYLSEESDNDSSSDYVPEDEFSQDVKDAYYDETYDLIVDENEYEDALTSDVYSEAEEEVKSDSALIYEYFNDPDYEPQWRNYRLSNINNVAKHPGHKFFDEEIEITNKKKPTHIFFDEDE
jgi:hypothetical protein